MIEFQNMQELRSFYDEQVRLLKQRNCQTTAKVLLESGLLSKFTWTPQSIGCYSEIDLRVLISSPVSLQQYQEFRRLTGEEGNFTLDGNIYFSIQFDRDQFVIHIGRYPGEMDLEVRDVKSVILQLGIKVEFHNQIAGIQRRLKEIENIKRMCEKAIQVYGHEILISPKFPTDF